MVYIRFFTKSDIQVFGKINLHNYKIVQFYMMNFYVFELTESKEVFFFIN